MRTIIKAIGIYDKPFIWVTFQGKAGYTIAVVMPFGSNDNTTAFRHVPAKAKITGRELNYFVEEVKRVICSNAANPDMTNLKALFSKEVDEKEVALPVIAGIKSKEDGPIAYRMYGIGTG